MNKLNFLSLLRCPQCKTEIQLRESNSLICSSCNNSYPIIKGRPIIFHKDNKIFKMESYLNAPSAKIEYEKKISYYIPSPSVNLSRKRILLKLKDLLNTSPTKTVLVVGSGNQRDSLNKILIGNSKIQVFYCDVDIGADIDIFCDAHDLPFKNEVFDAVITTAVLEHVLYPERVACEIARVVKVGGFIYSELPFIQQVHEGAYDFTRYTLSAHRRLFNRFKEIESGMVAGPSTALLWSIENFFIAFSSNKILRSVIKFCIRILLFWIKYFDYFLVNSDQAMDGASCTYILGRKIEGLIDDSEIIQGYVGANPLRHT